jgi:hypothetical protein
MLDERFPIRIGRRSGLRLRLVWGVKADHANLEIGDSPEGELLARFGRVSFAIQLGALRR